SSAVSARPSACWCDGLRSAIRAPWLSRRAPYRRSRRACIAYRGGPAARAAVRGTTSMATVAEHYERSDALRKVSSALDRLAPDGRPLALDELRGFDHFHTAGQLATARLADLLAPSSGDVV